MKKFLAILFIAVFFTSTFTPYVHGSDTDNIVIVLDDSGSMSGSKMRDAKSVLYDVLKKVPTTTNVGLLTFSGWYYELGPKDDAKLTEAISKVRTGGGTPLSNYMKQGADALMKQRLKSYNYGSYRLLILTDGEANDKNQVVRYAREIKARGIRADVIGIDMSSRHSLAEVAHSYVNAKDKAALMREVEKVVLSEASVDDKEIFKDVDIDGCMTVISSEMAAGIIKALANQPNHPIGSDPGTFNASQDHANRVSSNSNSQTSQPSSSSGSGKGLWIIGGVVLVLILGACILNS